MNDSATSKKLSWAIALLIVNFLAMIGGVGICLTALLPKVERAVQTAERVEARFQSFADNVQPVLTSGASKAMETIKKIDSNQISEKASNQSNALLDAAAEKAKRLIDGNKNKK